jgi:hypothetical protein
LLEKLAKGQILIIYLNRYRRIKTVLNLPLDVIGNALRELLQVPLIF